MTVIEPSVYMKIANKITEPYVRLNLTRLPRNSSVGDSAHLCFDEDLACFVEEAFADERGTLSSRRDGGPGVRARGGGRPRIGSSSDSSSSSRRAEGSARAFPFAEDEDDFADAEAEALAPRLRTCNADKGSSSLSTSSSSWPWCRGGVGGSCRSFVSSLNETRLPLDRLRCPGATDAGRMMGDELGGEDGIGEEGGSVLLENLGSYEYGYGCGWRVGVEYAEDREGPASDDVSSTWGGTVWCLQ